MGHVGSTLGSVVLVLVFEADGLAVESFETPTFGKDKSVWVFHGTTLTAAVSIFKNGFDCSHSLTPRIRNEPAIYGSLLFETAENYARLKATFSSSASIGLTVGRLSVLGVVIACLVPPHVCQSFSSTKSKSKDVYVKENDQSQALPVFLIVIWFLYGSPSKVHLGCLLLRVSHLCAHLIGL